MGSSPTAKVLGIHLAAAVSARLRHRFEQLPAREEDVESFLARLVQTASDLPLDVLRCLLWFRAAPEAPGALLLTGVPIGENIPPTPTDAVPPSFKPSHVSDCAILAVAILLGEPVAYVGEKGGALVQNVFPTRAQQTSPSNESSAVPLEFHTEITFSRMVPTQSFDVAAPDFILLLCLRSLPDRPAVTSIIEARDLCRRLKPEHVAALKEPRFQVRAPHSFTANGDGNRPWSPPLALIRGPTETPCLTFDIACGVRALSSESDAVLAALRRACADPTIQRSVRLGPGELLVIDNNRCAHARSQFEARFDGRDRWLQRTYVRRDIRTLESVSDASFRVLA
jgi:L-asparagine oxygenase